MYYVESIDQAINLYSIEQYPIVVVCDDQSKQIKKNIEMYMDNKLIKIPVKYVLCDLLMKKLGSIKAYRLCGDKYVETDVDQVYNERVRILGEFIDTLKTYNISLDWLVLDNLHFMINQYEKYGYFRCLCVPNNTCPCPAFIKSRICVCGLFRSAKPVKTKLPTP